MQRERDDPKIRYVNKQAESGAQSMFQGFLGSTDISKVTYILSATSNARLMLLTGPSLTKATSIIA